MSYIARWWVPTVLALLAAFTWWLQNAIDLPSPAAPVERARTPDYAMEGPILTVMNLAGEPDYRLSAAAMQYYRDDGSADLEAPQLTFFREGDPPWMAHSERGWVSGNGEIVRLLGHAVLYRLAGPQGPEIRMVTRDLTLYPKKNYAETESEVTATMGSHQVNAKGLRLFLGQRRLDLLSNVRGVYAPTP
jgi:lipopolysaccharide export system protein LptC